jgi:hypothetical protein
MKSSTERTHSIERRALGPAALAPVAVLATLLEGCRLVGGVFKVGMWIGVIAIIAVLAIVGGLVSLFRRTA